jgi:hypothetical protein
LDEFAACPLHTLHFAGHATKKPEEKWRNHSTNTPKRGLDDLQQHSVVILGSQLTTREPLPPELLNKIGHKEGLRET